MMMNSTKNQFNIPPGSVIAGKWHNNRYTIIRELGRGAVGVVFLAEWNHKKVAIKLSDTNTTITAEVNVLKSFSKAQGVALGPSLLDVDDWVVGNTVISFYVMEYIQGINFLSFIKQKGTTWVEILILQLLSDLDELHQQGWVFGDLKPDNLIVTSNPVKIRCIDVGGTTLQGRAIKEFTEFYDRGYWGLGSRRAEPSYDLFAVAMIMINAYYLKRFTKQSQDSVTLLKQKIQDEPSLKKHEEVLLKAIRGQYQSAGQMRKALLNSLSRSQLKTKVKSNSQTRKSSALNINQTGTTANTRIQKKNKKSSKFETLIIFLVICFLYALYIYEQIM